MAPKKKAKVVEDVQPEATKVAEKVNTVGVSQGKKEDVKTEKVVTQSQPVSQPISSNLSTNKSQNQPTKVQMAQSTGPSKLPQKESQKQMKNEQTPQKINLQSVENMSQNEIIQLRKLRFGGFGTTASLEEAERLKQDRIKKFGLVGVAQDTDTLNKRKQKFSNVTAMVSEDDESLKKRREKFGLIGVSQEKEILDQRKKKFGKPQVGMSLDDQIQKSKNIRKDKFNKKSHNSQRFANRGRR